MTDVALFHTVDGGEIEILNGLVTMDDGLEAAAYLSLFGGNVDDSGDDAEIAQQWWGNLSETNPARQYRSEFQYLLQSIPATTGNLVRLEDAAVRDLTRTFVDIAALITARASMPAVNRVALEISIEIDTTANRLFEFSAPWGSQQ